MKQEEEKKSSEEFGVIYGSKAGGYGSGYNGGKFVKMGTLTSSAM